MPLSPSESWPGRPEFMISPLPSDFYVLRPNSSEPRSELLAVAAAAASG